MVAVKVCHAQLQRDTSFASMFLDEARLAARIHHPNVVATLDVGEANDALYLVMEYIDGDRLLELLRAAANAGERLPIGVTLRIMIDLLSGLHAAHELTDRDGKPLNIVHRDVSPQNIMVGVDGVSRILDFGVAKAESRISVSHEGVIKGKLSYMAPEQISWQVVSRKGDIFSAGVVLWESLVGRRLFRGETNADTIVQVLHEELVAPSTLVPSIPAKLDEVVLKGLARNPGDRYANAQEFAEALDDCGVPVAKPRDVSASVHKLLGAQVAKRRALVRNLASTPPPPMPGTSADGTPSSNVRVPALTSPPPALDVARDSLDAEIVPGSAPILSRRAIALVGGLIAVAGIVFLVLAFRGAGRSVSTGRSDPSATTTAGATPVGHPSATTPAAPPTLPATGLPAASTIPPGPNGPPSQDSPANAGRPRAPRPGTPRTPTQPQRPGRPRNQPPSEFRVNSI